MALVNEQQVATQLTTLCMYKEVLEPYQIVLVRYPVVPLTLACQYYCRS